MKKKKLLSVLVAAALSLSCFATVPIVSQATGTGTVDMLRLYNPNSGEHFYTADIVEKDDLVSKGWKYEGVGWIAPTKSNTPVYRLYNPNAGEHHYTTDSDERQKLVMAGWKDEGTGWYSDDGEAVPLYREFNPNATTGTHNYTSNLSEHNSLVSSGWTDEGIGWYGLTFAGTFKAPEHQIEMKSVPIYVGSPNVTDHFSLYFADGVEDLAFADLFDWAEVLNSLIPEPTGKYDGFKISAEVTEDGKMVILKRETGYEMAVDFENRLLIWDDYCGFLQGANAPYLDLAHLPESDEQGQPVYLSRIDTRERHGHGPVLDLSALSIPLIAQDGKYLVPLQTLSAFTLFPKAIGLYYNQECLIATNISSMKNTKEKLDDYLENSGLVTPELAAQAEQNCSTEEEKRAYIRSAVAKTEAGQEAMKQFQEAWDKSLYGLYTATSPKGARSKALTAYSYDELCLELDFFYGLKDAHNIKDFATFFAQTGQEDLLLDPDALTADNALYDTLHYWLDDGHSASVSHSYLVDPDYTNERNLGFSIDSGIALSNKLTELRGEKPEAGEPYYEVGNTAYVTFDNFNMDTNLDYYAAAENGSLPDISKDTISLIYYAHQQINRKNSPIENVVLDLSTNGGGMAPAAIWTLGWFLGDAQLSVTHTATDAETTVAYRADVNFDHKFDEDDTISDLNLYCLTSPVSFSCGNLVPWAFKADGRVTLLGRVTGGGSCSVLYATTPWGTSYQLSGPQQISFLKNGAYYDVDRGVEPDYFIRDYHKFYDRKALTQIINGLN